MVAFTSLISFHFNLQLHVQFYLIQLVFIIVIIESNTGHIMESESVMPLSPKSQLKVMSHSLTIK